MNEHYLKKMTARQLCALINQESYSSRQKPIAVRPVLRQESALAELMSRVKYV